jgi:hypothetical protein
LCFLMSYLEPDFRPSTTRIVKQPSTTTAGLELLDQPPIVYKNQVHKGKIYTRKKKPSEEYVYVERKRKRGKKVYYKQINDDDEDGSEEEYITIKNQNLFEHVRSGPSQPSAGREVSSSADFELFTTHLNGICDILKQLQHDPKVSFQLFSQF